MPTILRPYQNTFVADVRVSLAKHRRIIAALATGGGKTKIFTQITKDAIAKATTVLIITEATKIYGQIKNEIGQCTHIAEGAKEMYIAPGDVYVAMAQTLQRRPGIIKQFAAMGKKLLVITDEAHIGTQSKVLLQLLDAYHIGFTATPDYRVAKHLPKIYNDCVIGPQPQDLIDLNFLASYNHYQRQAVDVSGLQKTSTGDYTEASQEIVFETAQVYDGLFEDLSKFKFYKGMIYCASIKHCNDTVLRLRACGYECAEVHTKNPKSDFELFQFTNGHLSLCVSVGSLTKGFDFPAIDLIILLRATTSLPLMLQMIGRGARWFPGKRHFNVIDYGKNGSRHGFWNEERDWSKMWNAIPKRKADGVAPVKDCPKCGCLVSTMIMLCPACGHQFIKPPLTPQETELIEITAAYNELRGRNISTLTVRELVVYTKATGKKLFANRIARAKGDRYLSEYAQLIGWKHGWNTHIIADQELNFADIIIR